MARSNVKTWLSLDRWFDIMGIHPLHANQLVHAALMNNNVCGEVFFQREWQHSDRVGRESIAQAIQEAEQDISMQVGYNLMPDWTVEERLAYPQPDMPGVYGLSGMNPRGQYKSVELKRGHIVSGGMRTKAVIQAGVAFARQDDDSDGFQETCVVTVVTSVTDPDEIHLYYPAKSAADGWEIRPIAVSISGGNVTIRFKIWQVVAANQQERIDAAPLDATLAASYETTVDIYRVYNDPATQVQFMWENDPSITSCGTCQACQLGTQAGCFHLRDPRLGLAVPAPASWNSSTNRFDETVWAACREPDQVRFWYYSGFLDLSLDRPYVDMAPYWEYAVAYYAASKLDRPVCGCSNVEQFIQHWRRDAAFSSQDEGGFTVTPETMANKIGTTMGALYAYKRINKSGIRVIK